MSKRAVMIKPISKRKSGHSIKRDGSASWYGKKLRVDRPYTERQENILEGDVIPINRAELTRLIKKAEALNREDDLDRLYDIHDELYGDQEKPKYTVEEALAILEALDKR